MGKIIIAGVVGFASFILGMAGLYFTFPAIAPERAIKARQYVDSLMAVPGGQVIAHGALQNGHGDQGEQPEDSTLHAPDTLSHAPTPRTEEKASQHLKAARDSVRVLSQHIARLTGETQTLKKQLADARKASSPQTAQPASAKPSARAAEVAALSTTLSKLEDKELRPILQQVDSDVLEQLYRSSSSKNQARLLQAMPADRAARFVQTIINGTPSEPVGKGTPAQPQRPSKAGG